MPREALGLDFREAFWPAAHAVLNGNDPYPALDSPALAERMAYAYPPVVAIVLARSACFRSDWRPPSR